MTIYLSKHDEFTVSEMSMHIGISNRAVRQRIKNLGIEPSRIISSKKVYYSKESFYEVKHFGKTIIKEKIIYVHKPVVETYYISNTYWIIPSKLNLM